VKTDTKKKKMLFDRPAERESSVLDLPHRLLSQFSNPL
jgi:hypothetical protein